MLNPDRLRPPHAQKAAEGRVALLDFATLSSILWRRRRFIGASVLLFLVLGIVIVVTTTPMFTAESDILIDTRSAYQLENSPSAGNSNSTLFTLGMDPASVDSQVEILKSERVASLVLRTLKLERDPEFTTPGSLFGSIAASLRSVLARFSEVIPDDKTRIPREVIEEFQDRLDVKRTAQTYVMKVAFRARTRERAAAITNEVANAYLTDQLQAKYEATRRAGVWLQNRIKGLQAAAVASDAAVQEFKIKNNIVSTGSGRLVSEQQVGDMSYQLVMARSATAEAEAKYNRLKTVVEGGDPDAATADVVTGNDVFGDLRQRYSAAAKRMGEVSDRLAANHPAVVNLRNEMRDIRRLMLDELNRALEGYRSAVAVAKARERSLDQSLAGLSGESAVSDRAQVQLRDLERDAATNKTIYETFLERYKTSLQQESFPVTEARVLSEASPPRLKSHPKTFLILALSAIGGFAAGVAFSILNELTDNVFRTPKQLESALELPCIGVLPTITPARTKARVRPGMVRGDGVRWLPNDIGLLRYAVDEPFTRFAETLRAIKLAAGGDATRFGQVKVLSLVSAVPGEGKSTVAMNLAQLLAHSGKKILLIDADFRSPTLSQTVASDCRAGLAEVLQGRVSLTDVLMTDPVTGMRFLPSLKTASPHASEALSSDAMVQLLKQASVSFDLVIVDLPPLLPIVDVRAISPLIDAFVYIARWGSTPIVTAVKALSSAPVVCDHLIGSVLNRADLKLLRRHTEIGDDTYAATPAYQHYISD